MPGDAVMERKMYTAKKEIAGWCNSSTKEVDKAMFQTWCSPALHPLYNLL